MVIAISCFEAAERLALLARDERGDLLGTLADLQREADEIVVPLGEAEPAPVAEGAPRGGHGVVELLARGVRRLREYGFGGRIDDAESALARLAPAEDRLGEAVFDLACLVRAGAVVHYILPYSPL